MQQIIKYEIVADDPIEIQVTCTLIIKDKEYHSGFFIDRTLLHTDYMWKEIRSIFKLLDARVAADFKL